MEFNTLGQVVFLILGLLLTFFFWYTVKIRFHSNARAYDYIFLTLLLTIFVGRLLAIISLHTVYLNGTFSLYPFAQDSSGSLIISENMPWIFFKFLDGGFSFWSLIFSPVLAHVLISSHIITKRSWSRDLLAFVAWGFTLFLYVNVFKLYKEFDKGILVDTIVFGILTFVVLFIIFSKKFQLYTWGVMLQVFGIFTSLIVFILLDLYVNYLLYISLFVIATFTFIITHKKR